MGGDRDGSSDIRSGSPVALVRHGLDISPDPQRSATATPAPEPTGVRVAALAAEPPQWAQSGGPLGEPDESGGTARDGDQNGGAPAIAVLVLWPEGERARAACIVAQESEWLPWKVGRAGERGLFGIHPVHAWRFEKYGGWDMAFDPMVNAQVAKEIWDEQGWVPWTSAPGCR